LVTGWRHGSERLGRWLGTLAWYWITIVVGSLLGLSLFGWVGSEVVEQETGGFDDAVRTWVLAHQNPQVSTAFRVITIVGSANALALVALVMAVWLWSSHKRHIAAVVASAPAVAIALFVGVKDFSTVSAHQGRCLCTWSPTRFPAGTPRRRRPS